MITSGSSIIAVAEEDTLSTTDGTIDSDAVAVDGVISAVISTDADVGATPKVAVVMLVVVDSPVSSGVRFVEGGFTKSKLLYILNNFGGAPPPGCMKHRISSCVILGH
jgi:hypothetical protein